MSGKRALVRYQGARGRGAMAWVACQGVSHWDRMDPEMYRETLARGLGSHDIERPIGTRCHAGCEQEASHTHSLICTRGGMQTHTHDAILHRFLVRALKDCRIAHDVETEAPFKEGTGNGNGNYRMDVVTGYGALLRERPQCVSSMLMLDVTVTNPCGRTRIVHDPMLESGSAVKKAIESKHEKYRGTYHDTYTFLPLAFSTCGDYGADVHSLVKDLGRIKAGAAEGGDDDETEKESIARETGRLRRELSMTLQRALSYRTLRYANKQRAAERGTRTRVPRTAGGTQLVSTVGSNEGMMGTLGQEEKQEVEVDTSPVEMEELSGAQIPKHEENTSRQEEDEEMEEEEMQGEEKKEEDNEGEKEHEEESEKEGVYVFVVERDEVGGERDALSPDKKKLDTSRAGDTGGNFGANSLDTRPNTGREGKGTGKGKGKGEEGAKEVDVSGGGREDQKPGAQSPTDGLQHEQAKGGTACTSEETPNRKRKLRPRKRTRRN